MSGPSGRRPSTRTVWPGLPTTVEFGGTSATTTVLAPTLAPWPTVDRPEQLGAGADRHVVLDRRMALAALKAGAAERDPLVDGHARADLGGLADHDAGAVVDEEVVADPGGRVDLDPGDGAGRRRARRDDRDAGLVQGVGEAVGEDRLDPSPGGEDLERAGVAGRGVAVARGGDVGADLLDHPGEGSEAEHGGG